MKINNRIAYLIFATIAIAGFSSCDKTRIFERYEDIPDFNWKRENKIAFDVPIKDTSLACRVILNLRCNTSYAYKNIYLFLDSSYPDGSKSRDTLEFFFNDDAGKFLGKCSGDICENRFLLKDNIKFNEAGNYRFEFAHAMRSPDGNLKHVMNVGLRVEKMQ